MPDDGGGPVFPGTLLPAADHEIAALLYAGKPRTPAGFRADDTPSGFEQVTTYHLKAHQVPTPSLGSHELCTDDWNEALAWSAAVAARSPQVLDFVTSEATERYFELDHVPRGHANRFERMRVFRCSYLDRAGVDLTAGSGFAGMLRARPLDAGTLRDLSEYLWFFTPYNNVDHAVLASEPRPATGLAHALTIARLERAVSGSCDRISVHDWTHTANPENGVLELTISAQRDFGVRREGMEFVSC
jgi:hypothetical protein